MKNIYILPFLFFSAELNFSMPPHPRLLSNLINLKNKSAGYSIKKSISFPTRNLKYMPSKTTKTIGNLKFPVLLGQFINLSNEAISTPTFYSNLLNGTNDSQLSLRKFYHDMSGGKLNLTFVVYGIYTARSNYEYYGETSDDIHIGEYIGEIVDLAISNGIDFSQFDNDNDGKVDGIIVIHAGQAEEVTGNTSQIWSHRWTLSEADGNGPRTNNGKIIDDYTVQSEYIENAGDTVIGVFAHELGHIFGLPDLYDTTYETYGVGDWSLMSYGAWLGSNNLGESPTPFLSWEKAKLGWITVENVSLTAGFNNWIYLILISFISLLISKIKTEKIFVFKRLFLILILFSTFNLSCFIFPEHNNDDFTGVTGPFFNYITIDDIEQSRIAKKILLPDSSGKQYLLIENKVKISNTWTEYLPGDGLLILRINENFLSETFLSNNDVNAYSSRIHGIEIVEADGNEDLRKKINYGDSNDTFFFENNNRLTPDSIPPMIYFTNNYYSSSNKASIYIENISKKSNQMSFTVR